MQGHLIPAIHQASYGALVLLGLLFAVAAVRVLPFGKAQAPVAQVTIPAFTAQVKAKLEAAPTFNALVSYTDNGFEPRALTMTTDTVRFTNNSHGELWLSESSSSPSFHHARELSCGESELDSCGPVAAQDFWQFTFDTAGTWLVENTLRPDESITITVTQ